MKKNFLFIVTSCLLINVHAQTSGYWQQKADYSIDVSLNDKEHTLDAFETIVYTNNSPDTLTYIWFHIWPNAYKNDKTAFCDQQLQNGNTKFYFSSAEDKGYINRLDFKVNGEAAKTEDHPQHIDIIKLILPELLLPKQQITITTPFHIKLPLNFSRSGHVKQSYQIAQWYPKPAVYDAKGWHPIPYLDLGEFYGEFGKYDVRITIPKDYVVAATGELQNADEKEWMKKRTSGTVNKESEIRNKEISDKKKNAKVNSSKVQPKNKSGYKNYKQPSKPHIDALPTPDSKLPIPNSKFVATKTLHYIQDSVHDFAWFADKNFMVSSDTCQLTSGKIVDVYTYYTPKYEKDWNQSLQYCKDAIRFYSKEVGEYPYKVVSAVQAPPGTFNGGMEYPTITLITPLVTGKLLDNVLAHEIGHNWIYGILGSNERNSPWMDEGVNSFYERKYMQQKYGAQPHLEDLLLNTKAAEKTDQPIAISAENFSDFNYGLSVYNKTAIWLENIQKETGAEKFKTLMQEYYQKWRFKHPQEEDFKQIFAPALGANANSTFNLLHTTGAINPPRKGLHFATPLMPKTYKSYAQNPTQQLITVAPAIGYNKYDKFMIGGLISNYKLPPSPFQFVVAPLYATGSKQLNGIGRLSYSIYTNKAIRRTEFFVSGATFSMDKKEDSYGKSFYKRFQKLVPGFQLTFKEKDPLSTVRKSIQWKTFLFKEDDFHYPQDTVINDADTSIFTNIIGFNKSRYLNQLQLKYENFRTLYPYDITLNFEQAKDFIRPTVTANYFFNYPNNGGVQLRFFAGKFMYTGSSTHENSYDMRRYHLQMTGPNGDEDYTYSNYFIGRNDFNGMASQQIMMRDGGFKVRTDLLSNKVGQSDNWLMALNLSATIPSKINPLSVIGIPVKIFADIGSYSEAWKNDSETDHFIFDGGLQLSMWNGGINVYVPLVYSSVYKNYIKGYMGDNRFWKKISFSIDLNRMLPNKIKKEVDL